jgi:hypothetical protein
LRPDNPCPPGDFGERPRHARQARHALQRPDIDLRPGADRHGRGAEPAPDSRARPAGGATAADPGRLDGDPPRDRAGRAASVDRGWRLHWRRGECRLLAEGSRRHTAAEGKAALGPVCGPHVAGFLADLLRSKRADLRFGEEAAALTGSGRVAGVRLESGGEVAGDFAVVGAVLRRSKPARHRISYRPVRAERRDRGDYYDTNQRYPTRQRAGI